MLTSVDFYRILGDPYSKKFEHKLIIWDVPTELEIGVIPKRIYCHPLMVEPLTQAFKALIETDAVKELKTWDGCWNRRTIRGYEKKYAQLVKDGRMDLAVKYLSVHCWACAIDVNQAENGLGMKPKLSATFVKCFTDAGFVWGGHFKRQDGMHFELADVTT